VTFHLQACRLEFAARDSIHFPAGHAGNMLRGVLGRMFRKVACAADCPGHLGKNVRECGRRTDCPYARLFEPASIGNSPSGLSDWPRPFVLRIASLDGRPVKAGEQFCFGLNLFDERTSALEHFTRAFAQWAELISVEQAPITLDLNPSRTSVSRIRVQFQTPTELKTGGRIAEPTFPALLTRARDRVSTLRSLYGAGPLDIDFRGLAQRSQFVNAVRCELQSIHVERRSSRTGQRHVIGGFTGFAEYEGDLAEFLPYFEAAHWTGVGRHCTWGNGQIHIDILNS
jgi:CRISPR-associated endoribonuclease Cas6